MMYSVVMERRMLCLFLTFYCIESAFALLSGSNDKRFKNTTSGELGSEGEKMALNPKQDYQKILTPSSARGRHLILCHQLTIVLGLGWWLHSL